MRKLLCVLAVAGMCTLGANAAIVGGDDFDGGLSYLTRTQSPLPGAFSSPGDGFEPYQVGVSASIPFTLVDDSGGSFPGDSLGIIDSATKFDGWFGSCDIVNGDNPSGTGYVEWTFDISGYTGLSIDIDMGAMGDFEAGGADYYDWTYSIDGSPAAALFTSSVDDQITHDYTMADGLVYTLADPMFMNGVLLDNNLATHSAAVAGAGSVLTLRLDASSDGGSEGYAFDNVVINGVPEPTSLALLALGGLAILRRR